MLWISATIVAGGPALSKTPRRAALSGHPGGLRIHGDARKRLPGWSKRASRSTFLDDHHAIRGDNVGNER